MPKVLYIALTDQIAIVSTDNFGKHSNSNFLPLPLTRNATIIITTNSAELVLGRRVLVHRKLNA